MLHLVIGISNKGRWNIADDCSVWCSSLAYRFLNFSDTSSWAESLLFHLSMSGSLSFVNLLSYRISIHCKIISLNLCGIMDFINNLLKICLLHRCLFARSQSFCSSTRTNITESAVCCSPADTIMRCHLCFCWSLITHHHLMLQIRMSWHYSSLSGWICDCPSVYWSSHWSRPS